MTPPCSCGRKNVYYVCTRVPVAVAIAHFTTACCRSLKRNYGGATKSAEHTLIGTNIVSYSASLRFAFNFVDRKQYPLAFAEKERKWEIVGAVRRGFFAVIFSCFKVLFAWRRLVKQDHLIKKRNLPSLCFVFFETKFIRWEVATFIVLGLFPGQSRKKNDGCFTTRQ